jgi:membrane protein
MSDMLDRLENVLFERSRVTSRPWGAVLCTLRYPVALVRDWVKSDLSVQAMSLAYTTLLSLVPLLVFSFSILKGLGARTDLKLLLHEFFRPLGNAEQQMTEGVLQFVANMRGDVLGAIGLVFLIYTVVSTMQKVEASFNFVWRVARPRTFMRRFSEYLSIMIAGPILLAVALELLGTAEHSPFALWLDSSLHLGWALQFIAQLVPFAIVTVVFAFMYFFIPNVRVAPRAAIIGGLTAGVIWALVGQVFTTFIVYSSQMLVVYTGFAIVLTTLIWVYLSWLILLIGAQLAFYLQFPQYLRHGHAAIELTGSARERMGLSAMYLIGGSYLAGGPRWTVNGLSAELEVPADVLAPVLGCLEGASLIATTGKDELLPGRDPQGIALTAIMEALRAPHSAAANRSSIAGCPAPAVVRLMDEVETALRQPLGQRSLKEFIAAAGEAAVEAAAG